MLHFVVFIPAFFVYWNFTGIALSAESAAFNVSTTMFTNQFWDRRSFDECHRVISDLLLSLYSNVNTALLLSTMVSNLKRTSAVSSSGGVLLVSVVPIIPRIVAVIFRPHHPRSTSYTLRLHSVDHVRNRSLPNLQALVTHIRGKSGNVSGQHLGHFRFLAM